MCLNARYINSTRGTSSSQIWIRTRSRVIVLTPLFVDFVTGISFVIVHLSGLFMWRWLGTVVGTVKTQDLANSTTTSSLLCLKFCYLTTVLLAFLPGSANWVFKLASLGSFLNKKIFFLLGKVLLACLFFGSVTVYTSMCALFFRLCVFVSLCFRFCVCVCCFCVLCFCVIKLCTFLHCC